MSRKKRIIALCIALAAIVIAAVLLWFLFLQDAPDATSSTPSGTEPPSERNAAEEFDDVDYDEASGTAYVNNAIVVVFSEGTPLSKMRALKSKYGFADFDEGMAELQIGRFTFDSARSHDQLQKTAEQIKAESNVDDAYLDTVIPLEGDATAATADAVEPKDPTYPNDPYGKDSWDMNSPGGKNWAVEAVHAPLAWAYRDQAANNVRIGLIDHLPLWDHEDLKGHMGKGHVICMDEDNPKQTETNFTTANPTVEGMQLQASDHGTHVAGIMNASYNNKLGIAGMMAGKGQTWYSEYIYKKNGAEDGRYATCYAYDKSITWLAENDVQAINISQNTSRLRGFAASRGNQKAIDALRSEADHCTMTLRRLIKYKASTTKKDFVICVAAGNSNATTYKKDDSQDYGWTEASDFDKSLNFIFHNCESGGCQAKYNNFLNLIDDEEIKSHIIVVGALEQSSSGAGKYAYTDYSNVGGRVDIAAPGTDVYSCYATSSDAYDNMSGTSMATPMVTGAAGYLFACNGKLTGPQVKQILISTEQGRYDYQDGHCGMLDAGAATKAALASKSLPVNAVTGTGANGLDLCFVVDTTGSMGDDIADTQENMSKILEKLRRKTRNYRVALVDYRDFPDRTGDSGDYAARVRLNFTNDNGDIHHAIDYLDLGDGGDTEETVYSGMMAAVKLPWRSDAAKTIIVLGDAAPLDPEPHTGYTYADVLKALKSAGVTLDGEDSDGRVLSSVDGSEISVYSIGASADDDASDFFEKVSKDTGGAYSSVEDASGVSDAIMSSIDKIDIAPQANIEASFGKALAGQTIDLYPHEGDYLTSVKLDSNGSTRLDALQAGNYTWSCRPLGISGTMSFTGTSEVTDDLTQAKVETSQTPWFAPLLRIWQAWWYPIVVLFICLAVTLVALPAILYPKARAKERK